MEYNNWYNQYQQYQAQPNGSGAQRGCGQQRRGVSVPALIACMLVTALLGGALGGFLMKVTAERQQAALPQPTQPAAVQVSPEQEEARPVSPLLTQGTVGSGYTRAQIVEVAAPSVVGIDVEIPVTAQYGSGYEFFFGFGSRGSGSQQVQTGSGSGVIITSDGYIVTCHHVVAGASKITVILNDESAYEATVIGTDERNDLAVIKIDASGLTPATLGDSDMLTCGEDVVAIGNPLGELRGTSTGGMVSALGRGVSVEGIKMSLIQHDAAVSPGSSGGGLFNGSGSLIGIVNAKASTASAEGIGFAIPVNSVKQIISDLIEHGYVKGRAWLGVMTQNVTLQSDRGGWGTYFGYGGTRCVQVGQVIAGSAAEKAGILAGDLILAVDDTPISSTDDLTRAIGAYNAGDQATLTVQRNGEQKKISVTFLEYNPNS